MRYRLLGSTGLRVSELFLGAMTFGERGGAGASLGECRRIVDAYADAGGNVVDTAVSYRGGESEEFLGQLLGERRDRFVVSSKYTVTRDPSDPNAAGNHRKNLRLSLETSLRRLRTDYVDLYWVHMWDRHTPIEETMRALDDVVGSGKVLYVGISDAPSWVVARANTLAEWRGLSAFAALQAPYSLINRDIERELLPMAESFGMTVAAWSPLGSGVLSGKYTRPEGPGDQARLASSAICPQELAVARAVQRVADELGYTPAQVALAWTRVHSPAVHPIIGARTLDQLRENLGCLDVDLPADAVKILEDAMAFHVGFPVEFLTANAQHVFGEHANRVDA
ncbi:aldo/keto reductase [Nocardia sp. CDC159]|uniref:Aldo/keto reductase n=1 Tax=Nocardia pulmonis TaxID=2951408 RepID=A0A9X2ECL5_9NOCA|nr:MULTISPECIES: aldo/keto reductase [Nocardia]MCM6775783.1 aldo/keto reductase [Nocardia pulmonis]MCM6788241.1 aldo/keto reductase [Nocardia sp. CDC159]